MNYKLRTAVGAIALAITSLLPMTAHAGNDKVTICHAKGNGDFVTLTISEAAVYGHNGNAGHFDENGTSSSGHEDDYFGQCQTPPEPTTPPTEPPSTEPPSTEPPVTTEPPTQTPTTTTTVPPVTELTEVPYVFPVITDDNPPCYPQSSAPGAPCGPTDPCITFDGFLYTDGFELGRGDSNDRLGSTLWTVIECHISVLNPGEPAASAPLPKTGGNLNLAVAALVACAIGGGLWVVTRRKAQ